MQLSLRRSRRIAALTLAAALVAVGCGGSSDDGASDTTDIPTTEEDAGTPQPGGSLTYALEADASGGYCLPTAQLAAGGIQVAQALYDPLLALDEDFEVQPFLAESYSWNDDYTALTLKLRDGIKFHDGSDLTAEVVKLNVDSWRGDSETEARTGLTSLLFRFVLADVTEVTVDDPMTVTIHTSRPWMALTDFLAAGRSGIVAEAQLMAGEDGCKEQLIGTGPFKLVSWTPNVEMKLTRNENYWLKDADGNQLPYLDELVFKPIEGGNQRLDALVAGTVQAAHFSGPEQFKVIRESDDLHLIGERKGHREVSYGMVNAAKAPTDDLEVRKHLAMAIDRDALLEIQAPDGDNDRAYQPFDSDVIGFLEEIADGDSVEYDPDAAEEFFAGKNIELKLKYATDPIVKLVVEETKAQLEEVGVKVSVTEVDQATLINEALGGDFNVVFWRNHPGMDPDTQYNWWKSGSPVNFGRINDPRIDENLDKGRTSSDPEERRAAYEEINRAFREGYYNMWTWYSDWGVGAWGNVHGLASAPLPDGSAGPGVTWGWHSLAAAWVEQ